MKKAIKFLNMAALVLVGAMTAGCSGYEENIIEEPQVPSVTDKVVTLKTTVNFDSDNAATRALSKDGKKTFAEGDQIAVVYQSDKGIVKAVSNALTEEDIKDGGKSATITVTLTNILANSQVRFYYPANMMTDEVPSALDVEALESQDGTLSNVSKVDYCSSSKAYDLTAEGELPASVTLENRIAVCAFTFLGTDILTDITSSLTQLTISDGDVNDGYNTYTINRSATAGPIYVAMWSVDPDQTITITATDGTNNYTKEFTGKTLLAGHFYPIRVMFGSGEPEFSVERNDYGIETQTWN